MSDRVERVEPAGLEADGPMVPQPDSAEPMRLSDGRPVCVGDYIVPCGEYVLPYGASTGPVLRVHRICAGNDCVEAMFSTGMQRLMPISRTALAEGHRSATVREVLRDWPGALVVHGSETPGEMRVLDGVIRKGDYVTHAGAGLTFRVSDVLPDHARLSAGTTDTVVTEKPSDLMKYWRLATGNEIAYFLSSKAEEPQINFRPGDYVVQKKPDGANLGVCRVVSASGGRVIVENTVRNTFTLTRGTESHWRMASAAEAAAYGAKQAEAKTLDRIADDVKKADDMGVHGVTRDGFPVLNLRPQIPPRDGVYSIMGRTVWRDGSVVDNEWTSDGRFCVDLPEDLANDLSAETLARYNAHYGITPAATEPAPEPLRINLSQFEEHPDGGWKVQGYDNDVRAINPRNDPYSDAVLFDLRCPTGPWGAVLAFKDDGVNKYNGLVSLVRKAATPAPETEPANADPAFDAADLAKVRSVAGTCWLAVLDWQRKRASLVVDGKRFPDAPSNFFDDGPALALMQIIEDIDEHKTYHEHAEAVLTHATDFRSAARILLAWAFGGKAEAYEVAEHLPS